MDRKFKTLRPAIPSPTPSESGQASRSQSAAPFKRKKRVQVKVACDICRLKKSAVSRISGLMLSCALCTNPDSQVRWATADMFCLCETGLRLYLWRPARRDSGLVVFTDPERLRAKQRSSRSPRTSRFRAGR